MSLRDANVVIIDTSRTIVRAGIGLHELLKTPSVEVLARVGLRSDNAKGAEPTPTDQQASSSRLSAFPQYSSMQATVNDYLVGSQLDEALASGQNILISWPFADGDIRDWVQAEAIWKHVLFKQLQRRRAQNESPVMLCIAPGLTRASYERICQIFFERFNVAGLGLVERPMAQIYACNSISGVVVDIGLEKTDVTLVSDGFINHQARESLSLGLQDCQNYLAHLLRFNQTLVSTISPADSPMSSDQLHTTLVDLVKFLCEAGHIRIPSDGETAVIEDEGVTDIAAIVMAGREKAVIENAAKKKSTAKGTAAEQARAKEIEALDLLTVDFQGHSLTIGKERHRFCEPLFDPTLLNGISDYAGSPRNGGPGGRSLQELVGRAVQLAPAFQRQYLWRALAVTGDITRHVRGVNIALQSRLAPYIASTQPDLHVQQSEVQQPRKIGLVGVPDYYPEYRDTGDGYASFLGASITAKLVFNEQLSRSYVSKTDYSQRGPHSIIEASPSLL